MRVAVRMEQGACKVSGTGGFGASDSETCALRPLLLGVIGSRHPGSSSPGSAGQCQGSGCLTEFDFLLPWFSF